MRKGLAAAGVLLLIYLGVGYVLPRVDWLPEVSDPRSAPTAARRHPANAHTLSGVIHVHTDRSHDAVGTEVEVARAARSAGLDFVILSDHLDPTDYERIRGRPARFIDGVLLIRGQETALAGIGRALVVGADTLLRSWGGGLARFDSTLARYDARAIVAHPRSRKDHYRWRSPALAPRIVGWEVLDLADVARARLRSPWILYHLTALLVTYPVGRADGSLLRLYREGFQGPWVAAYDSAFEGRPVTAVAGLDAHPKVRVLGRPVPAYGSFFRTLVNHVVLPHPLSPDPGAALDELMDRVGAGDLFISLGGVRDARRFYSRPSIGHGSSSGPLEPTLLRAGFRGDGPDRLVYRVVRDGATAAWVRGPRLSWRLERGGTYRLEVYRYALRLGALYWNLRPWIFTNPGPRG